MLSKAYNDNEGLNGARQYWKDKYFAMLEEAKKLGYKERQARTVAQPPEPKKEFTISYFLDGKKMKYVATEKELEQASVGQKVAEETKQPETELTKPNQEELEDLFRKEEPEAEETELEATGKFRPYVPQENSDTPRGNLKRTKHTIGHKTKDEVLVGIFPNGDVVEFESWLNDAVPFVWERIPELKGSRLTGIPKAARRNKVAYGIKWSYQSKEQEVVQTGEEVAQ
jgi:hypothetical protein